MESPDRCKRTKLLPCTPTVGPEWRGQQTMTPHHRFVGHRWMLLDSLPVRHTLVLVGEAGIGHGIDVSGREQSSSGACGTRLEAVAHTSRRHLPYATLRWTKTGKACLARPQQHTTLKGTERETGIQGFSEHDTDSDSQGLRWMGERMSVSFGGSPCDREWCTSYSVAPEGW